MFVYTPSRMAPEHDGAMWGFHVFSKTNRPDNVRGFKGIDFELFPRHNVSQNQWIGRFFPNKNASISKTRRGIFLIKPELDKQ